MSRLTTSDWIQLVGGVLIIAGFLLVLYELKQGRQIAGAELVSQQYDAIRSHYDSLMGENPAEVLSKACIDPGSLDRSEQRVLNAYFNSQFVTVRRMQALETRGDFASASLHWEDWATGALGNIFGYPDGKHWWERTRHFYLDTYPDVVELGDQLAKQDLRYCETFYEHWGANDA